MTKRTQIFSIFGQIEAVVAQAMVDEGTANKIASEMIPPTALYNNKGERARFAVIIAATNVPVFERRIADLRA